MPKIHFATEKSASLIKSYFQCIFSSHKPTKQQSKHCSTSLIMWLINYC